MAYTALYRKWRPKTFKDVIGQDHIVKTLTNQMKANRIGHAYLFCGTRGTGKTSTAKIFARAVNCQAPEDGSPCNDCDVCQSINEGKSMNIIEIDAASNNGVDNIREIRDEVRYTPTEGKYKVYIIDEVHMLSTGAFNALLKTLEEPPGHVIFILATTEPHKIPITILSRCQRYDFKRISIEVIANKLKEYMAEEQLEVEEKAIRYIAKVADGSMRDALSILDQCISFFLGEALTLEKVLDILGAVDTTIFVALMDAISVRNVTPCLELVDDLMMQGKDLGQFIYDFTWFLRNILIVKTVDQAEQILDLSEENLRLLKEQAEKLEQATVIRYIRIFSELANSIKYASQKRVLFEVALIKLCVPSMEEGRDSEAVLDRLIALEQKIEQGVVVSSTQVKGQHEEGQKKTKAIKKQLPKALTEDMKKILDVWGKVLEQMPPSVRPYLRKTTLDFEDHILIIIFEEEIGKNFIEVPERKSLLQEKLEQILNKSIEIALKVNHLAGSREEKIDENFFDQLQNKINFDITYEE